MIFDLAECEEIVGHSFRDKQILRTAFTHTSYANEHNTQSYERMEYLGDALLDFFVAEYLYRKYPEIGEGELTTRRAAIVAKTPLKKIAQELNLGSFVLLGEGMKTLGGDASDKILSSLIESAIAALYLDGGIEPAKRFVETCVLKNSENVLKEAEDSKSQLQEHVQKYKLGALRYEELAKTGPDHSPTFESRVLVGGKEIARGSGAKKQLSEQNAARAALRILRESEPALPTKKGGKVKRKHPQNAHVLTLVADYGEKSVQQAPSSPKEKDAKEKSPKGKKEKPSKRKAKPQTQAKAPKQEKASVAPTPSQGKEKSSQKQAKPQKNNQPKPKPSKAQKAIGKTVSAPAPSKKKMRFGFVGNARSSDGTPL